MGEIRPPDPVKLFIGMLSPEPSLFNACTERLVMRFGPADHDSVISEWSFTKYYAEEMGHGLLRKFVFFGRLIDPGELAEIKSFTNMLEEETAIRRGGTSRRRINLDPGYMTEAKVVLATTKDYSHRLYIGRNIFAEVTLQYRNNTFTACEHTYPDFRTREYIELFNKMRTSLRSGLKRKNNV